MLTMEMPIREMSTKEITAIEMPTMEMPTMETPEWKGFHLKPLGTATFAAPSLNPRVPPAPEAPLSHLSVPFGGHHPQHHVYMAQLSHVHPSLLFAGYPEEKAMLLNTSQEF